MPSSVLLVDDNLLFRQGLAALMAAGDEFTIVGAAADGRSACDLVLRLAPDLVLIDVTLGGANGLQVAAEIKRFAPAARVAVLTSSRSAEHLRQALFAGVEGYLLKESTYEELMAAMRIVIAGRRYLSPEVSGHLVEGFLHPQGVPEPESPLRMLTSRERSVLQLIAEGRSNRVVAHLLGVSTKTVEKHRASVMRKLGLRNSGELMLVALETGLIERPGTVKRFATLRTA